MTMPLDAQGNFRHNHEAAQMHSQAAGKSYGEKETKPEGDSEHVEIHPHGDGTFHTMHKGEQVEHDSRDHEDETGAHEHLSEVMGGEPDGDEGEAQPEMAGKGLGGLY
jgi:hypothetical protein